MSLPSTP